MSHATERHLVDLCRQSGKCIVHHPVYEKTGSFVDISIDASTLLDAARLLSDAGYYLEDVTGVHVSEGIWLIYHFDRCEACRRVTLRVFARGEPPSAPSLCGIFKGADWHERECFDFFGVRFDGHPNLKPLLLPDDIEAPPLLKISGKRSVLGLIPIERWVEDTTGVRTSAC
ncbi:MAG: NADH-quinone oxidoreductase subunit C [Thermodesulfobacteriota bacterium]